MQAFALGNKLGRGPVGAAYAARLQAGAHVVVKILTRRFSQNPTLLAEILADLRKPIGFRQRNVGSVLEVGEHEGRHVVVSERVTGITVADLIKQRGRLPVPLALRIARDVGMGLAYAHERGLIHGDLRPAKVYFDEQRGATIADMGQHRASCLAAGFGSHGMHFGHPFYLAPEALQDGLSVPTTRCDVYALGMMFFEMVTGQAPFQGEVVKVLHAHLESPLPPPPAGTDVTPSLSAWLIAMTRKRPRERPGDGKAVVNSLYTLMGKPGPFPEQGIGTLAPVSSGSWQQKAQSPTVKGEAHWSESLLQNPMQVGPDSLGDDIYGSGEIPEPEPEPPPPPKPKPAEEKPAEPEAVQVRLGQKLGRAHAGAVYDGDLKGYEGKVAIKVLTRRFAKYPELLEEILATLRRAAGITDPNLISLMHVIRVGGRDVAVMELAQGKTLREVLRTQGPQSHSRALGWISSVAAGLRRLAHDGISHGDIRPEKIFIHRGGARLADLGFAKASCLAANFGQFGMHFGHPTYLAPEVHQDHMERPNVASDMYSVGVLLYEIICGRPPYVGSDPKETLLMHLNTTPPAPPKQFGVPAPLAELMVKLIAKSPAGRPQSWRDLVDAIQRCQKQVLLTTGLRKVVSVDEFDLADSGDETSGGAWLDEARKGAERTGTWSKDKIGNSLGKEFELGGDSMSSLDPDSNNPFGG